ncbi:MULTISPECIES: hypothetical protein [unclassified Coleofasciculus]|uniref:hypothetical protein n=1 Tax=unclassified Coleofasciculus TaxID=2692782 RepID=UPI001881E2B7|nr:MULTISPECIES: hypothetical protein [unclassified Coleofasciculus]MBE9126594.1 hypothetical protein [Coleofasciculus sp. LEGE 07081]MBE9149925.1 hypothetical protein [Coleofasciculus sp. LEGE 07092]
MQDETRHSSLLLNLKQECDRPMESCLVSRHLLIHKQGLDSLNPTYSEGRSHSFLLRQEIDVNGQVSW